MGSIYASIKNPSELVRTVGAHGLSTELDDIVRAQDIFGRATVEELVNLANGNIEGRINNFPEKSRVSQIFYQILFSIWHWEDATRFYNQHSNQEVIVLRQELGICQQERDEAEEARNLLQTDYDNFQTMHENLDCQLIETTNDMNEFERKLKEAEHEILVLKAKLYDCMAAEKGA